MASSYTFVQFRNIIQRFVKANENDVAQTSAINDCINLALYEVARERRWPELLITASLTPNSTGAIIAISATFMEIERLRFTSTADARTWRLMPRTGLIPPAPIDGKPRCYELVQDTATAANPVAIKVEPFAAIVTGGSPDVITLDYYSAPALLSADVDKPKSNMWDMEIIRKAEAHYLRKENKLAQANSILGKMQQAAQQEATSPPQN